ncbi:hypothetical protein GCM10009775_09820 [Microbacterium aoyamense]|uniref:Tautomerase family protein n=2 Tax=Microbacterium aoyamense TaxID=344166 RepID=A0ABN2PEB5_9MICO
MPLIQIDLERELFDAKRDEISSEIHAAQTEIEELQIPEDDKFQIFRPHGPGEIVFDPTYNDLERRSLMVITVFMVNRYPVALKNRLFQNIVRRLATLGIRPEDILISNIQNGYEDWLPGVRGDRLTTEA